MPRKPFPFKIGSDPECTLLYHEKKMHAEHTFNSILGGSDRRFAEGHLGIDGCSATAELRPNAAFTADSHADNIGKIFEKSYPKLKNFEFTTISLHAPVGGHIHLDLTSAHAKLPVENFILPFLLPIWLSEDPISRSIRKQHNYANIWNFKRGCASTTIPTLEVRSPSAEWMTCRASAVAILGYMGTVWNEIIKRPELFQTELLDICGKNDSEGVLLSKNFMADNKLYTGTVMKKLRSIIKTFEFYPEYKNEIDLVLNPKKLKKLKTSYEFSIYKGWNLNQKINITQEDFIKNATETDDEILDAINNDEEYCDEDDQSIAKKFEFHPSIGFNKDKNIELLSKELAKHIFSSGLKPKRELFLFGLRSGIPSPIIFDQKMDIFEGTELIKTEEDLKAFKTTASKMISKAKSNWKETIFSIKAGEGIIAKKADPILIGIPIDWRKLPIKIDEFLKLTWKYIKNENPKGKTISEQDVTKDQRGDFAKAIEIKKKSLLDHSSFDHSSQGFDLALRGLRDFENEQNQNALRNLENAINQTPCNSTEPVDHWYAWVKQNCRAVKLNAPSHNPLITPGIHLPFVIGYEIHPNQSDVEFLREYGFQNDTVIVININDAMKRIRNMVRRTPTARPLTMIERTASYFQTSITSLQRAETMPSSIGRWAAINIPSSILESALTQTRNSPRRSAKYILYAANFNTPTQEELDLVERELQEPEETPPTHNETEENHNLNSEENEEMIEPINSDESTFF